MVDNAIIYAWNCHVVTSPKQAPKIPHPCCRLITPLVLDQYYVQKKTQVIKAERRVLKELGFCVHVKHPHKLIVMYLQALGFEKHQSMIQMSWNYMNDSLRSDVFVQFDPETIACACIYLTARKLQIPLPKSPAWFSLFNADETDIQDICRKILKLYTRPKVSRNSYFIYSAKSYLLFFRLKLKIWKGELKSLKRSMIMPKRKQEQPSLLQ